MNFSEPMLQGAWMKLSREFILQKSTQMLIFKIFNEKSKTGERCICWADKYSIKLPLD